jgi:hypothetical protein
MRQGRKDYLLTVGPIDAAREIPRPIETAGLRDDAFVGQEHPAHYGSKP